MLLPVAVEMALTPYETSSTARLGSLMRLICTRPPANSAERSGEYDLATCTLSSRPEGNMSSGTTFLSGSVVGTRRRTAWCCCSARPGRARTRTGCRRPRSRDALHRGGGVAVVVAFISCAPRLSVITGAFLRSMSCTTCDEVMASTGASPRTVTVSVKFAIDRPTADAGGERHRDHPGLVAIHLDLQLVGAGRQVDRVAAVHVGVDGLVLPHHLDRDARQRDGVRFVADDTGDPHAAGGGGLFGRSGERRQGRHAKQQGRGHRDLRQSHLHTAPR
jgi:hypothetical protein